MPADQPRTPSVLSAHTVGALVLAGVLVLALRVCALPAIVMDGNVLIEELARADGRVPLYYHARYLPLGALVEFVVGGGRALDALLWLSILSGAATCVVAHRALARAFGVRAATLAVVAFACAPAFWFMSTNVELHATQALGGAVVLSAALASTGAPGRRAAVLLAAAVAFATLVHNSNVMLAPGAVLIAARRVDATIDVRRMLRLAVAGGAAGVFGLVVDEAARRLSGIVDTMRLDRLVFDFAVPLDLQFLRFDVLRAWFPVLVVVVWGAPRSRAAWRAAWPFLAGAFPAGTVFVASSIESVGGYFGSTALFFVAAALAGARSSSASAAPHTAPLQRIGARALFAGVCLFGCFLGLNDATSIERERLVEVGRLRFELARRVLPDGGLFVSLDPDLQCVSGRGHPVHDLPVAMALTALFADELADEVVFAELERQLAGSARRDEPLAFNMAWRGWAGARPDVVAFHERLLAMCELHYRLEPRDFDGIPFLVGVPRARGGSS